MGSGTLKSNQKGSPEIAGLIPGCEPHVYLELYLDVDISRHKTPPLRRSWSIFTFMPISMLERSAKGTSLVTSSHSSTAKLHMSAERRLMSSGFFCRADGHTNTTSVNTQSCGRGAVEYDLFL